MTRQLHLSSASLMLFLFLPLFCMPYKGISNTVDPGVDDRIIWMQSGSSTEELRSLLTPGRSEDIELRSLGFDLYLIQGGKTKIQEAEKQLSQSRRVRHIGINPQVELRNTTPNDPEYGQQSYHTLIGSEKAWDISTGGTSPGGHQIVVGIMDAGFSGTHEDIAPNLWINPSEIPGDGLDNDNNGFIDDYDGYNPRLNNGEVPVHHHGHSVSGYIGGKGNNGVGIAGINWDVKMLLVGPTSYADEFISGFRFMYDWRKRFNETLGTEGAYIVALNLSLGFEKVFPEDLPWMCPLVDSLGSVGILVVGAAPNQAIDIGNVGDMPCLCGSAQQICVTNTTIDDDLVSNAGYSKTYIQLSAPGYNSYTVKLESQNNYGIFSGTSAAAPMVTGAIALLASMPCLELESKIFSEPQEAASLLRLAILSGVEKLDILENITATGGRLFLFNDDGRGAVNLLSGLCGSAEGPLAILKAYPVPSDRDLTLFFRSRGSETFPLRVYNILGQVVYAEEFESIAFSEKATVIATESWSPGIYVVVIGNRSHYDARKIIVQH
ncbi:MAG: S8 family peptidase [Saprospiraceae bacterium]|nr:S8 family peptidase [Saprospiraceae bacterium]